jgi:hypothetical protein
MLMTGCMLPDHTATRRNIQASQTVIVDRVFWRWPEDRLQYVIVLLVLVALLVGGFALLNRPLLVLVDAEDPADFPTDGFSHQAFEGLLSQYVDSDGNVSYDDWHKSAESVAQLDSYLAAVSRYSPDNSPERFATQDDELAYWIYGYNAYVIKSVLHNWPISSVTDVKAPLEVVTGLGFFYRLRFQFGGRSFSLLGVENNKIRKRYQDARIHFVLNCASDSCPVMRRELPTGQALQDLLEFATTEFVGDPKNVSRPAERGLIDYIASVAPGSLRADLNSTQDYEIVFSDYDWSLNAKE